MFSLIPDRTRIVALFLLSSVGFGSSTLHAQRLQPAPGDSPNLINELAASETKSKNPERFLRDAQAEFEKLKLTGTLAFTSNITGNADIYVIGKAGPRRLTNHPKGDRLPSWSPDGKKIAFTSNRDGNWEIYVMDADGNNVKRLTRNNAYDDHPVWSPDGKHILFYSDGGLFLIDVNGLNTRKIVIKGIDASSATWSPDGSKIAFDGGRAVKTGRLITTVEEAKAVFQAVLGICVSNADGSDLKVIAKSGAFDMLPAWSPSGKKIAFVSNRDDDKKSMKVMQIYVMHADGSHVRRLTNLKALNSSPAWSPDGSWIAFNSSFQVVPNNPLRYQSVIYVMRTDSSKLTRLTHLDAYCYDPVWKPISRASKNGVLKR